jgi:hypothetical protein
MGSFSESALINVGIHGIGPVCLVTVAIGLAGGTIGQRNVITNVG